MNTKLTISQFLEMVENDRIFTVEFIKRTNGERRVMTCRRGVSKGVTGKGHSFNPASCNLLCVFDMQKSAFRMVNLEDLISLKANGKTYVWSINDTAFLEIMKN